MAFLSHFNNVSECGISPVNVINSGVPRLYMLSLRCAVNNYSTFYKYNTVKNLSPVVYVDLFRVALEAQNINLLCREMKFDTVCRLLCIPGMEDYLIPCFQTVIEQGVPLHKTYSCAYQEINLTGDSRERKDVAEMGINLGSFLYVCGYFEESMMVLNKCKDILRGVRSSQDFENVVMKSFYKLLMVQASSMEVRSGNETMMDMMEFMEGLRYTTTNVNDIPLIYTSISMLYQSRSEYDKAYKWAKKAVLSVRMDTDASILPEVLGKAARACSDERDYERSLELIKLAISCAKVAYGERHHKYADTLIDYAYCLLNADNIIKSAYVCQKGLSLLLTTFGNRSMRTAIAEQDMAYIKYALNYSAVVGEDAMYRIESALETMNKLMKPNSLWFAHAYRTKALILEEKESLVEAERLHEKVFIRYEEEFGGNNLMTAHAYCNLARIYQTCNRLDESEELFIKSIDIKTRILGETDTEVAITNSLLGSLYVYHKSNAPKAIELYRRAISSITRNHPLCHSSLEFTYKGMMDSHYRMKHDHEVNLYLERLREWNDLRLEIDSQHRMDRDIFENERYTWDKVNSIFDQLEDDLIYLPF